MYLHRSDQQPEDDGQGSDNEVVRSPDFELVEPDTRPVLMPAWANSSHFTKDWEGSVEAMAISDAKGINIMVNPSFLRMFGFRQEEVLGKSFAIIFPEAHRRLAEASYQLIFNDTDPPRNYRTFVRDSKGLDFPIDARMEFLTWQGERVAIFSVMSPVVNSA